MHGRFYDHLLRRFLNDDETFRISLNKNIDVKYVGQYRGDVKVYESTVGGLGEGAQSGGITLPPNKIVVGKVAYNLRNVFGDNGTYDLFSHEFGHVLQGKKVGIPAFFDIIASESLNSATFNIYSGHNEFWTETWANQLSYDYFTKRNMVFDLKVNFAKPLSKENITKFINYFTYRKLLDQIPTSWNTN